MKIKILPLIIISLSIIVFIIFFKGLKNSNIYTPNVNIEKNIPIFTALSFDEEIKINSNEIFQGDKFYLLNIWSSWCMPCREEHSFLIDLSKNENLIIVGLNYKDKKNNALSFLSKLKNPYNFIFLDKDGTVAIEWGAYGVPETFLIHEKKIIKKVVGPINQTSFSDIKKLLK
jgi:cytochrome c biogenesis protein CcmG/thiol:disulfide interchange protein DsbE